MRSIILIGDSDFSLETIKHISHIGNIGCHMVSQDRFVVEYENEFLFYDFIEEDLIEYEEETLIKIPFNAPKFISLSYHSKDFLKRNFEQGMYPKGIYVDDDNGYLGPIEKIFTDSCWWRTGI